MWCLPPIYIFSLRDGVRRVERERERERPRETERATLVCLGAEYRFRVGNREN